MHHFEIINIQPVLFQVGSDVYVISWSVFVPSGAFYYACMCFYSVGIGFPATFEIESR